MIVDAEAAIACIYGKIAQWFNAGDDCYVIRCGHCSGNLIVIDLGDAIPEKLVCARCGVTNFLRDVK